MTFKDLEDWQKELVVKNLDENQTVYIEYTKDDIVVILRQENQELSKKIDRWNKIYNDEFDKNKNQQKKFIEWLENESKKLIRDAGYHQRICLEILDKYKEIIGSDNK